MFGGAGLYRDGVMFGLVSDGDIYLKCDPTIAPMFERAGCRPFAYKKGAGSVTMSYWSLPEQALDDPDALKEWADVAFASAMRGEGKAAFEHNKAITARAVDASGPDVGQN
jgi:DNA transformation protein and related proteins